MRLLPDEIFSRFYVCVSYIKTWFDIDLSNIKPKLIDTPHQYGEYLVTDCYLDHIDNICYINQNYTVSGLLPDRIFLDSLILYQLARDIYVLATIEPNTQPNAVYLVSYFKSFFRNDCPDLPSYFIHGEEDDGYYGMFDFCRQFVFAMRDFLYSLLNFKNLNLHDFIFLVQFYTSVMYYPGSKVGLSCLVNDGYIRPPLDKNSTNHFIVQIEKHQYPEDLDDQDPLDSESDPLIHTPITLEVTFHNPDKYKVDFSLSSGGDRTLKYTHRMNCDSIPYSLISVIKHLVKCYLDMNI